ncbi:NmrA family NAD(P)-binding protein [Embleya sp. NPDC055664]|uniref:NmrA family NAD(P)-binding protein n=1 Tax=Embleya sp. NPDC059237 TaxID=3346784 RepID=UPI00368A4088
MIVVMGATGTTGSALLHRLVALGVPSRALSRDPDALRDRLGGPARALVEVRGADAADPDSLRKAFDGASQLFLAMANSPAQVAHETCAISVAAAAGIRHVVKLSAPEATSDSPVAVSRGHHTIEQALRDTGLPHTVLRPYAFMQKLLTLAPSIAAEGVFLGSMGNAPCNYVDCRDIADVAAEILTRPDLAGHTYTLTGDRTYTNPELADLFRRTLGRPIRYIDLPTEAMHTTLTTTAGLPGWLADHIVEIQQLAITHPESPTRTVETLLNRPPRTLESFLTENAHHFQ